MMTAGNVETRKHGVDAGLETGYEDKIDQAGTQRKKTPRGTFNPPKSRVNSTFTSMKRHHVGLYFVCNFCKI